MTRSAEDIELIQSFLEESESNLPEVERMLEILRPYEFSQPFDLLEYISFMSSRDVQEYKEALRVINRYVHTIKGSAAFMELQNVKQYCHELEELTVALASGRIFLDGEAFSIIERLPSLLTRFFEKISESFDDSELLIDDELMEISQCVRRLQAEVGEVKIRLDEIQDKDFGLVRQARKNIKVSVGLEVYDEMVADFQGISHSVLELLSLKGLDTETVFEISRGLNEHLEHLVLAAQTRIVLSRYHRIVLDLGRSLDKQISFVVGRNEAQARPDVWDHCHNALVHLVRNAVDHGIEVPSEREQAGKNRLGRIALDIFEDHKNIYINLEDDGRGIDGEKVARIALEKGVITELQYSALSDEDKQMLIFHAGFSTKSSATDVSGRGVGMDAVLKEIEHNLNGTLTLFSQMGYGTSIFIEIPKSEALTECVIFGDDRYTYAIPKAKEMEYLECQVQYVRRVMGQTPVYTGNGQSFPVLNVLSMLHPGEYDESKVDLMPIIKIRSENAIFGLIVPMIHGHQRLKIERRRSLKRILGHDNLIFGFALTDPLLVVLDSEQLQSACSQSLFVPSQSALSTDDASGDCAAPRQPNSTI